MAGSSYCEIFRVSTWGESHGKALGVIVDGCPSGISISETDIQKDLDRRKPGKNEISSKRVESDSANILSGVFEGKTTGAPIAIEIKNENANSSDYSNLKNIFRPGHADFGYFKKYGFRDYRGGGRSSGRETVSRVAAGAVAKKILGELGVCINAYVISVGEIEILNENFNLGYAYSNSLVMPDPIACEKAKIFIQKCIDEGDSIGSKVECVISGLKPGFGSPVFNKLDAELSKAVFSIGGVKAFEVGSGFEASKLSGSQNNDEFYVKDSEVFKRTNNSGGIIGGISDGSDIVFRAGFKPVSSIGKKQRTVNESFENVEVEIKGRHDPVIAPRAVVVVEAMAAIALVNIIFDGLLTRIESVKDLYINLI